MKYLQTASAITVFPEKPGQKMLSISKTDSFFEAITDRKESITYDEILNMISLRNDAFFEGEGFKAVTSGKELKYTDETGDIMISELNYLNLRKETQGLVKAERTQVMAPYIELLKKIQKIRIDSQAERSLVANFFFDDFLYTVNDDGTLYKYINVQKDVDYFRLKMGQTISQELYLGGEERTGWHKVLVQFDPEAICYNTGSRKFTVKVNMIDEDAANYADNNGCTVERYETLVECLAGRLSEVEPVDIDDHLVFKSTLHQNEFIDEYLKKCNGVHQRSPLAKMVTCRTFKEFLQWDKN